MLFRHHNSSGQTSWKNLTYVFCYITGCKNTQITFTFLNKGKKEKSGSISWQSLFSFDSGLHLKSRETSAVGVQNTGLGYSLTCVYIYMCVREKHEVRKEGKESVWQRTCKGLLIFVLLFIYTCLSLCPCQSAPKPSKPLWLGTFVVKARLKLWVWWRPTCVLCSLVCRSQCGSAVSLICWSTISNAFFYYKSFTTFFLRMSFFSIYCICIRNRFIALSK